MRLKWNTIKQVLQVIVTIITTILGTIAVQSCAL
ncbi:MAG: smalltalk protein [Prevotella sp.]|nr:smalltalk protein [Prevotella sp.]